MFCLVSDHFQVRVTDLGRAWLSPARGYGWAPSADMTLSHEDKSKDSVHVSRQPLWCSMDGWAFPKQGHLLRKLGKSYCPPASKVCPDISPLPEGQGVMETSQDQGRFIDFDVLWSNSKSFPFLEVEPLSWECQSYLHLTSLFTCRS